MIRHFLSLHVLSHVQPQSVFSVLLISVLMSILKYFKRAPKTASDELLPDPDGTLSKIVPPLAIKMANDEVAKVVNDEERKSDTSTDEPRGTR